MSIQARIDAVEVGDERLGWKGHGQGWETSVRAQIDTVEVGDERPG